jgi:hypothetical protein
MDADETTITERLRKLAEEAGEEPGDETIGLDKADLMATTEFRRLLDPASELSNAIEADLQDDESE